MPGPAEPPPVPDRRVVELLALEHDLDVANDTHPAHPNTWAGHDLPKHDPAPPTRG